MHKRRQLRCRSGAAARVRRSQIREAAQDQGKAQTASRGRFRPFRQLPKASEQAFSPGGCRFLNGGGCSPCRRRRASCRRQTRLAAADAGQTAVQKVRNAAASTAACFMFIRCFPQSIKLIFSMISVPLNGAEKASEDTDLR